MVFVGASKRFFLTFEMVKECIFLFDENSTFFEIFTHCGPRHQRPQKCRPPRPSAEIMANRFGCWRPMPTKSLLILHYYHFFSKGPQPHCCRFEVLCRESHNPILDLDLSKVTFEQRLNLRKTLYRRRNLELPIKILCEKFADFGGGNQRYYISLCSLRRGRRGSKSCKRSL